MTQTDTERQSGGWTAVGSVTFAFNDYVDARRLHANFTEVVFSTITCTSHIHHMYDLICRAIKTEFSSVAEHTENARMVSHF